MHETGWRCLMKDRLARARTVWDLVPLMSLSNEFAELIVFSGIPLWIPCPPTSVSWANSSRTVDSVPNIA